MAIVSPRDIIFSGVFAKDVETNITFAITYSADRPKYPPKSSPVRAHCHMGGWILFEKEDKTCDSVYVSEIDVKGNIPKSFLKMAAQFQGLVVARMRLHMMDKQKKKGGAKLFDFDKGEGVIVGETNAQKHARKTGKPLVMQEETKEEDEPDEPQEADEPKEDEEEEKGDERGESELDM